MAEASAPAWGDAANQPKDPRRWLTLAAVNFALFMVLLDVTVVNVALPSIAQDFKSSFSELQWVIDTYALVIAALILTMAKLGDLFGRKRLYLLGLVIFSAASLGCALSQNVTQLQIARGVQGIGGAILSPLAAAIISATFWGPELGTAFGIYGGVSGIALIAGPIVGGLLVKYANWQSVFLINVPIGIIGLVVGAFVIKESRNTRANRYVDIVGVLLSIATLFSLTLPLIKGAEWGWTSGRTLGWLATAVVLFVLFIVAEMVQTRRGLDAMMDLSLFRVPTFSGTAVITVIVSFSYAGLLFIMALLFQNVLGYDALGTGLRYIPFVIGSIIISPLVGANANRLGARLIFAIGLALLGLGYLLLTRITPSSDWDTLLPGLLIAGFGGAAVQAQLTNAAVSAAPREQAGIATGISGTMRQVGSSMGIALLGSIFTSRYTHNLPGALAAGQVPKDFADRLVQGAGGNVAFAGRVPPQAPPQFAPAIQQATHAAFVAAFNDTIRVAAVFIAAAVLIALIFVRRTDSAHDTGASANQPREAAREP
ncbi:MAG: MFS transporter, partial [Chloroflexota bacterium]|nr:MFS transporter [Chloroflexota bacterium]